MLTNVHFVDDTVDGVRAIESQKKILEEVNMRTVSRTNECMRDGRLNVNNLILISY